MFFLSKNLRNVFCLENCFCIRFWKKNLHIDVIDQREKSPDPEKLNETVTFALNSNITIFSFSYGLASTFLLNKSLQCAMLSISTVMHVQCTMCNVHSCAVFSAMCIHHYWNNVIHWNVLKSTEKVFSVEFHPSGCHHYDDIIVEFWCFPKTSVCNFITIALTAIIFIVLKSLA